MKTRKSQKLRTWMMMTRMRTKTRTRVKIRRRRRLRKSTQRFVCLLVSPAMGFCALER
jgi:hypothetical protein